MTGNIRQLLHAGPDYQAKWYTLPSKDLGMRTDFPNPRFWTCNLLSPMEKQDTAEIDIEHKEQ
jgi:hypothetical protein